MAVNKRKVLDAARKYAQKGAKEKALKEYHTLLKLDPRDAKLHLEIGDCYRRWGQIDEAITQYARVADQYKDDGFDARSVAVFKQILNLDPKRYAAYVSLSELYQRMGLDSEALGALQAAADGYHKEGDKPAALELLRKMATLDPTNTTSRLKVAELLRQEGMEDDAVAEYQEVVAELKRQGAHEQTLPVLERMLELRPDAPAILLEVARRLIEVRKPERAEPFVRKAVQCDPGEADTLEVAIDVYKALGNDDELATHTRALAKIYRDRGDQDKARELAQRIPLSLELGEENPSKPAIDETESAYLSDDELLDDEFLASDTSESKDVSKGLELGADDELELELDDEAGLDELVLDHEEPMLELPDDESSADEQAADDEPAPLPEGDPEQLLAEASVYLRYGKREQAIASLQAVLQQEPGHRAALERLGDAYAEGGDDVPAVAVWTRAAERAAAEGDAEGFEVLRDRIAALDADAAGLLEGPSAGGALDSDFEVEVDPGDDDFEIDVSVGDDDEPDEPEAEADDDAAFDLDVSGEDPAAILEEAPAADAADDDFEIDIDVDFDDDAAEEADAAADPAEEEEEAEDDAFDVEIDDASEAEDEVAAKSASAGGSSSTTSQQVAEDLEEAEFYRQQELFDEAEAIYRRVLKIAPNHPSALLRLGELAAARGDDPAAASTAASEAAAPAPEEAVAEVPEAAAAEEPEALVTEAPGEDSTEVAELSLGDDEEDDEPAVQIDVPPAPRATEASVSRADDTVPLGELPDVSEEESDAEDDEEEDGGFDLAAELRDVIEEDEDPNAESGSGLSTVEDGFESIFADFKQGVSATLSEDDYETRYDLGIAYREMELFEDAIGEFRMCLDSPSWKLASLHMMGLCALDLGRSQDAASHLEQALATPDLPPEQRAGLHFDLGRTLEVVGDLARARSSYQAALDADPDIPGILERIEALDAGTPSEASAEAFDAEDEGETFESFDDIVAEAQDDDEDDTTEQTEAFESFDDVITEVEAAIPAAEAPDEEIADAEEILEAEPAAEVPPEPAPKKKRNKKISFV